MGLSFHYSGKISKPDLLPELIVEIQDIAKELKWKYNIYDKLFPVHSFDVASFNQNIYGISFTPTNCETIFVCFLSNGRMSSPINLSFYGDVLTKPECDYLYMLSVKTQYAGIEIHQFIIQLFRYLNEKYFTDFNLSDEGQYWETNDETILRDTFKRYTDLLDSFSLGLQNIPVLPNESMESYFERLMNLINEKNKIQEK